MTTSPNLAIQELDSPAAIGAELQVNEAVRRLDALLHASIKDRDLTAPPGSPAQGDRYIVAASPSGAWAGQAGKIAYYSGSGWLFATVKAGFRLWIVDEAVLLLWDGSAYKRIGTQAAAVADLSGGADLPTTVSKVNALLASLRASGLLA